MPTSDDNHDNRHADASKTAGARTAADEDDKTEPGEKAVDKQQSPSDTTATSQPRPHRELREKLQNLEDKAVQERATIPGAVAVPGNASDSDTTPSPKPQMALQKNLQNLEDKVLQERATVPGAVAVSGSSASARAHTQAQQRLQKLEEKALHERATQPGAVAVSGPGSSNPLAQNLRNLEGKVLQDRATVPGAVAVSGAASSGTQALAQHLQNLEGKVLKDRATQPGAIAVSGGASSGTQALAQHLQNLEGKVLEQDRATQPGAVAVSGGVSTNKEDAATNNLARNLQNLEGKVLEHDRATQPGAVAVSGSARNLKAAPSTKQQIDAEIARTKVIARQNMLNLEDKVLQDRATVPGAVAVPGTAQPDGPANKKQQIDNEFARVNALVQQRLQTLEENVRQERANQPGAVAVSGAPANLKEPPNTNRQIDNQLGPSAALAQQHLQSLEGKVLQDRATLPGAVSVAGAAGNLKEAPSTKQQLDQQIATVNAQVQQRMQNLEEKVLKDRATLPGAVSVAGSAPRTKKTNDTDRQIDNEIARTNALLQQQRLEKDLHAIEEKTSQEKATEPGAVPVSASMSASSTKSEDVKRRIDKEFARTSAYAREQNLRQMEHDLLKNNNLAFVNPTTSIGGSKFEGMSLARESAANTERQEKTTASYTTSTVATFTAMEQERTPALETPVSRPETMLAGAEADFNLERIERKRAASPHNDATQAQMEVIDAKMANGMLGNFLDPGAEMGILEGKPDDGKPKNEDIAGAEMGTRNLDARLGQITGMSDEMFAINNPHASQIDRKHPMHDDSARGGASNLVEAIPVVEEGPMPIAFGTPENDDEAAVERAEVRAKETKRWRRTTIFSILFCLVLGIGIIVAAVTTDGFSGEKEDSSEKFNVSTSPTGFPTLAPTPYIVALPDFTLLAMEDPDSPQSLAYQWMQEDPLLAEYSDGKLSQRMALATLYFATNGDNWILNKDWLSYEVDECFWFNKFNITSGDHEVELSPTDFFTNPDQLTDIPVCDKDGTFLALVLSLNGLSGTLPQEVSMLTKLELLALANNEELAGTIATELGRMTDMRELSLGNTKLTGSIPSELGMMIHLEYLILREIPISGSLPSEIGSIASLKQIEVMRTHVTGTIPIEYYNLKNINFFGLYRNKLTGTVPTEVGLLSSSAEIYRVDTNKLSGSIPTEIGLLSKLITLHLEINGLTGKIPTEIGNLSNLEDLWLEQNFLTSSIPVELDGLSNLRLLILADLLLTGTVPLSFWNLPGLWAAPEISRNPFLEGSIPTEIGIASSYGFFFVYEMGDGWGGTIPSELGLHSGISWMWLHQSNLKGTIPEELGNLSALTQLRLHDNALTGTFPDALGSAPNLVFLTLNGTQLTGEVPEDACSIQDLYFDCLMMCGCDCAC